MGMRSWHSLAALGFYLGMKDAVLLADHSASHPGAGKMSAAIAGAASCLAGEFTPGVLSDLPEALAATDFTGLAVQEGERLELLADDLYNRLALPPFSRKDLPPFDVFDRHIRKYLHCCSVSLRATLYGMGIRKEIVSLENPAVRESVEEIRQLPCRACGQLASAGLTNSWSASLAPYVQSLLDRHGRSIDHTRRTKILDILDHLSACPEYYRQVGRESKAEAVQALVSAISILRRGGDSDPGKADLLAAFGIMLFNIFPSPAIIKYLAIHRPGGGSRFLQYEYHAILAMNFFRMGKRALAAAYCQRAYDAALNVDLKAYALLLEGCIALDSRDYRKAAALLARALDTAERRSLRSLAGFYLGIVHYEAGEIGQALNCFRDAQISAEGEADAMAACNNMGTCYMVLGDLARALRSFEETISLGSYSGRASVKFHRSVASGNAGIVYLSMREHELAREQFAKALRIARETGNARGVADQLMNIGLTHKGTGDYAAAASHFISALNYAYTIDYLEGVLYAREQISQALALQGKHDEEEGIYRDIVRRHPGMRKLLNRR
ncbi:MAG TPA: tetratricopeptide repeat protein [Methanocella sp.]|jgi:tetratricopeptide (TPR) repeat protein